MSQRDNPTSKSVHLLCYLIEEMSRISKRTKEEIVAKMGRDKLEWICYNEDEYHYLSMDILAKRELDEIGMTTGDYYKVAWGRYEIPSVNTVSEVYLNIIEGLGGHRIDAFLQLMNSPVMEYLDDYNSTLLTADTEYLVDCIRAGHVVDEFE